ncbi:translation initiation factor IF-2-like isoform X1 [Oxyura jamaicensis]|uniref:translation initiation factor IF-2-like isoform X1 n=1 Tax=Oxyura jamaicensis TaxID=8884 RepID=UPI0015A65397|nr:translation initiation factor IF-2-like isoform X1 [Oxyura jamaicensis]
MPPNPSKRAGKRRPHPTSAAPASPRPSPAPWRLRPTEGTPSTWAPAASAASAPRCKAEIYKWPEETRAGQPLWSLIRSCSGCIRGTTTEAGKPRGADGTDRPHASPPLGKGSAWVPRGKERGTGGESPAFERCGVLHQQPPRKAPGAGWGRGPAWSSPRCGATAKGGSAPARGGDGEKLDPAPRHGKDSAGHVAGHQVPVLALGRGRHRDPPGLVLGLMRLEAQRSSCDEASDAMRALSIPARLSDHPWLPAPTPAAKGSPGPAVLTCLSGSSPDIRPSVRPSRLHPDRALRPRARPRIKPTDTRIALEKQFYYETKNEMQCLPWHTTKHLKQITSRRIVSQIENTSYKIRHTKTKPKQKPNGIKLLH